MNAKKKVSPPVIPSYFYLFFRLVGFPFLTVPVVRCLPEEVGFPLPFFAWGEVPLYYLDSTNLKKEVQLPCFSEELCVVGDRVYISFESACNKYIIGKPFFATYIASYPIGE